MGTGKSSLGNCLLGRSAFEAKRSARAVTATLAVGSTCASARAALQLAKHATAQRAAAAGAAAAETAAAEADASGVSQSCPPLRPPPVPPPLRPLVVVDSPGFGDPSRSTTALLHEIKVKEMLYFVRSLDPHVFQLCTPERLIGLGLKHTRSYTNLNSNYPPLYIMHVFPRCLQTSARRRSGPLARAFAWWWCSVATRASPTKTWTR